MSNGVTYITVDQDSEGQRLDNFLASRLKGVPKSRLYRLLRKGEIRVNKKRAKPSQRLLSDDQIRVAPIRLSESQNSSASAGLIDELEKRVLMEDEHILIIDKPTGLAVHGGSGLKIGLIEAIRQSEGREKCELAHRLDRDTSGCLILAKNRRSLLELHRQLRESEIEKHYSALCAGKWRSAIRQIDAPLRKNTLKSGERVVVSAEDGKQSITHFRVDQRFKEATLLDVRLDTGRTHQIRVHAQLAGCPLVGDSKYSDRETNQTFRNMGFRRLFLHAARLRFRHPVSNEWVECSAKLPEDLATPLANLD